MEKEYRIMESGNPVISDEREMKFIVYGLAFVMTSLGVVGVCPAQTCNPEVNNSWTGGALPEDPRWSNDDNWDSTEGQPGDCRNVFITIPANTILDRPDPSTPQRQLLSLSVSAAGETSFGYAAGMASSQLYCKRDFLRTAGPVDHLVRLGDSDRALIGDPQSQDEGHGSTSGFRWDVDGGSSGRAFVNVTDTIGCGRWDVRNADLAVGYALGTGLPLPDALGLIDPDVCDLPQFPVDWAVWNLNTVWLVARDVRNLRSCTVDQSVVDHGNDFRIDDSFDVSLFEIGSNDHSYFRFGVVNDRTSPPATEGLEVLALNVFSTPSKRGPSIDAEKLLVRASGNLTIDDGTLFSITAWDLEGHLAPVAADFQPLSSLRYGHDGPPPPEDPNGPKSNTLTVDMREASGRQPAMHLQGGSYITTKLPRGEDAQVQQLTLDLQVHLDVEGILSQAPAVAWDTTTVDLKIRPGTLDDGNPPPVETEAIAADACNVFFTDLPTGPAPCLKYWRSLTVGEFSPYQEQPTMRLVDNHDNHRPNKSSCGAAPAPEAMYIAGDVFVEGWTDYLPLIDLNGMNLYYGGMIDYGGSVGPFSQSLFTNGSAIPLIKTHWGDFNGDCVIDGADAALFPFVFPGVPTIRARNPMFDFDGDCKIGQLEYDEFYNRLASMGGVLIPGCTGGPGELQPTNCAILSGSLFSPPCQMSIPRIPRYAPLTIPDEEAEVALLVKGDPANPAVACVSQYVQADGRLDNEPHYELPAEWGCVYIGDSEIIPATTYLVQAEYGSGLLSDPATVTTGPWGDTDGNLNVDVGDILCVVDAFGGTYSGNSCTQHSADLAQCVPDGQIDVSDVLSAIDAYAGVPFTSVCLAPCTPPGGGPPPIALSTTMRLERRQKTVSVGQLPGLDVYIGAAVELRALQIALDSLGADGTVFPWEILTIDDTRTDYVFFGQNDYPATDMHRGRASSALAAGSVTYTGEKYVGTVWFRVTSLGGGSMRVSLRLIDSKLRKSPTEAINIIPPGDVTINIIP